MRPPKRGLRAAGAAMLRLLLLVGLGALISPAAVLAEGRAIIVLDASGSMWDELGGQPKVEIARGALSAVLELGLMAYGHREKGNCADIELIVPPATGRAAAISTAAEFMNFTGKTPLTEAVRQAASALHSDDQPATVILITDGADNCAGDPCALARDLAASGPAFTAHVVGLGLTPEEKASVACLATETGGSYLQADDLAGLTAALQRTVLVAQPAAPADPAVTDTADPVPAPQPAAPDTNTDADADAEAESEADPAPPQPATAQSPNFAPVVRLAPSAPTLPAMPGLTFTLTPAAGTGPALEGLDGIDDPVPPGRYLMETRLGAVAVGQDVTVPDSGIATPEVILNAASVTLRPRIGPSAAVETTAITTLQPTTGPALPPLTGEVTTWLSAGDYRLVTRLDAVETRLDLTVTAGQAIDRDLFISAALLVPKVFYVPGMPVADATLSIEIVAARPNVDGSRTQVSARGGRDPQFHLGAGDYVAITRLGLITVETPFAIALVQRTELPIVLDAGVLAATAPGADFLEIAPPPDIAGNSPDAVRITAAETVLAMAAGSYLLRAGFGDQRVEASFVITPGQRTEISLTPPP
ncbi:MAG: VWA domain-containing protein [Rhodobacteraceae bacterium]|nr:VWA domain-containing protein [Paracoccaceae bacterium]